MTAAHIDALMPLSTDIGISGDRMAVGDFGLALEKYAEWGYALNSDHPTLTHDRMALPSIDQRDLCAEDEAFVDRLVAPGHASTPHYTDPVYPVTGRVPRTSAR